MTAAPATPVLSAIVVNWNTRRMTLDCLRSIEDDCAAIGHETIVIDNASTDGSPDAIAGAFPNARIIRNAANLGFARANNQGIAAARGRYLALINSDVIVLPGCIAEMIRELEDHADIGLISPRILDSRRRLQPNCLRFPGYWNRACETTGLAKAFPQIEFLGDTHVSERRHDRTRDVDILTGCFWVARAEAVARVGPLDENFFMYGEDMDWCRRFRSGGWRVVFHPAGSAIHFGGASSSTQQTRFFIELQKSILRYWRKHHGRIGWLYCAAMIALHQVLRLGAGAVSYALRPSRRGDIRNKLRRSAACLAWLAGARSTQTG
ncbi:glycosyltransferase family 2 protein [bacterium]|nr:glycosyltransferase family 2 protein [bacterium]